MIVDTTMTAPNNWFSLPREARAVMTAFDILDGLTSAIVQADSAEQSRRRIEAQRKPIARGRRS